MNNKYPDDLEVLWAETSRRDRLAIRFASVMLDVGAWVWRVSGGRIYIFGIAR